MTISFSKLKITLISIFISILILSFCFRIDSAAATFKMSPSSQTFEIGCERQIYIEIDATAESSNGAEIEIYYDPNQIDILDADSLAAGTQIIPGNAFDTYFYNNVNETSGVIKLAGSSFSNFLTTKKIFGTIPFKGKAGASNANFQIRFDGLTETYDSNIAESSTNLDLLTSITNGNYSFIVGPCSTDTTSPNILFISPTNGQNGFSVGNNIVIRITDDLGGISLPNTSFIINGDTYTVGSPYVSYIGSSLDYTFTINPPNDLPANQPSTIVVKTEDLSTNKKSEQITFNYPVYIPPAQPGTTPVTLIEDKEAPSVLFIDPKPFAINISADNKIVINIIDDQSAIEQSSLSIYINGELYTIANTELTISANSDRDLVITIDPRKPLNIDSFNVVQIRGADVSGNWFDRQMLFNLPSAADQGMSVDQCIEYMNSNSTQCKEGAAVTGNIFQNTFLADATDILGEMGIASIIVGSTWLILLILSILGIPTLIRKLIENLFKKKTKHPLGVVTDSITGKPIKNAVCTLVNAKTGKTLKKTLTDNKGRYSFILTEGSYKVIVTKAGFLKNSITVDNEQNIDVDKFDIEIKPLYSVVDPLEGDVWDRLAYRISTYFAFVRNLLLIIGLIFAIIAFLINGYLLNFIVLLTYIILLAVIIYSNFEGRHLSIVKDDTTGLPVPYAVIKIFNKQSSILEDIEVANKHGQFDIKDLKAGEFGLYVKARSKMFPSKNTNRSVIQLNGKNIEEVTLARNKNSLSIYVVPIS